MDATHHYRLSTYREHLVEHLFMARLLETAWLRELPPVEVLRCEADMYGYDLVLSMGSVVRHVQLKASLDGAQAAFQKVNLALAKKPAGCVVWVKLTERPEIGRIDQSYLFFGGGPLEPLPLRPEHKVARHTKANARGEKAERPNIRELPKRDFLELNDMATLIDKLFGAASERAPEAAPAPSIL